ncbi:hypothetical protein EYF80_055062 [Liparis tanakae]|uniref:Uncharacterized protein n=1 Tax=Liparis tanakae TaxID=230148 RepID=A0A4Z2F0V3_9TELE|nr:hypothetical protein EYF80_055062 [Liparis tanakae]
MNPELTTTSSASRARVCVLLAFSPHFSFRLWGPAAEHSRGGGAGGRGRAAMQPSQPPNSVNDRETNAGDHVAGPRLHGDGLVVHGDDVGGDVRPVAVGLLPLQEEAGGGGVARLRGGRELQEGEGGDRVGVGRRGPEAHLLAVRTAAGLVHRLRRRKRS